MKATQSSDSKSTLALVQIESAPDTLYSLERVTRLMNFSRRWIARCVRHGLIQPTIAPATEGWHFDTGAIHTLRRIERLQAMHGLDFPAIKLILDLAQEVERLRAEVRFLRAV